MIRHLVRCDPTWKLALWLTPLGVAGGLLLRDGESTMLVLPFVGAIAMLVRPHERATLFTASLPVPARQVLLRGCAPYCPPGGCRRSRP
jgi:hypothetical protein